MISGLDPHGVDVFRINLSHTLLDAVDNIIGLIRRHSSTPICLDTKGAQVRCGPMAPDVVLDEVAEVALCAEPLTGTSEGSLAAVDVRRARGR